MTFTVKKVPSDIRWKKCVAKLENLFARLNIDSKERKRAFCCMILEMTFLIYEKLNLGADDTKTGLSNNFHPKKNKFERSETNEK